MRISWRITAGAMLAAMLLPVAAPAQSSRAHVAAPQSAPAVIVDTDLHFDDLLSLSMLHALADRGELRPIGITISNDARGAPQPNGRTAAYVDAVNTFHGRPDLPIGVLREVTDPARVTAYAERIRKRAPDASPDYLAQLSALMTRITDARAPSGRRVYPHDLLRDGQAEDAVPMLRRLLAREPDGSVVLVQLGYSSNFVRLLASAPDRNSVLPGRDLVARKVRLLSLMGGSYSAYVRDHRTIEPGRPSTNMRLDTPAARTLFAQWPTQIVAAGDELGDRMPFPGKAAETDFRYVAQHPIAESYRFMVRTLYRAADTSGAPYDHKMTDEVALLYAVRPDAGYFELSEPGTIAVQSDGGTSFTPNPTGRHRFLRQDEGQRVRAQEAMTLLVTQPPARTGR